MQNEKLKQALQSIGLCVINNSISIKSLMRLLGKKRFSEYDIDMFSTKILKGTILHKTKFVGANTSVILENGIHYINENAVDDINCYLINENADFITVYKNKRLIDVLVTYETIKSLILKMSDEIHNCISTSVGDNDNMDYQWNVLHKMYSWIQILTSITIETSH